jgi:hypothetical protein
MDNLEHLEPCGLHRLLSPQAVIGLNLLKKSDNEPKACDQAATV